MGDEVAQAVVNLTPPKLLGDLLERDSSVRHVASSYVLRELRFAAVEKQQTAHEHHKGPGSGRNEILKRPHRTLPFRVVSTNAERRL